MTDQKPINAAIAVLKAAAENATPGPWELGEYDDFLGYDCMTGGVRAGPVLLDAANYGQARGRDITSEALEAMMADARYITCANPKVILALLAERERLREALKPFVDDEVMNGLSDGPDDKWSPWPSHKLGDYRRARAVLEE